jgi:hypothetical protein
MFQNETILFPKYTKKKRLNLDDDIDYVSDDIDYVSDDIDNFGDDIDSNVPQVFLFPLI